MAGSMNRATLIGNLTRDPEIRQMQSGKSVANISVATSESWKDKTTGERKERTEYHKIVVFSEGLVRVVEQYLRKGSKVLIEGQIQTRKWEKDDHAHYTTEIVLQGFDARLLMLDGKKSEGSPMGDQYAPDDFDQGNAFDDEIPF